MADTSKSFLSRQWEEYKGFWDERFSFLDNYSGFINRDKPLPSWSSDNVQEFIASNPHHGPVVRHALSSSSDWRIGRLTQLGLLRLNQLGESEI
ncbi:Succinate dehydrogenase subunit 6, mitochondrial [Linum perenne]